VTAAPTETEIKVRVHSVKWANALLARTGFAVRRERHFEANLILDTEGNGLRGRGELLRLRQADGRAIVTFKGAATVARHKSREELELEVSSFPAALYLFEKLGFRARFRYEKYRTEFQRLGDPGVVVLDETPIGEFLEIEGPPAWIDSTARRLGFAESEYLTASYGRLYLEYCAAHGTDPTQMVFAPE
jgi:adenylate cyclase class 2